MRTILFLFLTSGLILVNAQEQAPLGEEENVMEEKTEDASSPEKNAEIETPDTFDPTEKLSEDFPVAFPVDI